MSRKRIISDILKKSTVEHSKGYVNSIEDNLIKTIVLDDFVKDLKAGDGNELVSKFQALYSSSALAVNFFGFIKRDPKKFVFFGENDFNYAKFEKKLRTGLKGTPPNLDFYLENENHAIGFESKFLEILTPKVPVFPSSYLEKFSASSNQGLYEVLKYYVNIKTKKFLDSAQLLKHTIGLLNNKRNKSVSLVYIYWEPEDKSRHRAYKEHYNELLDFAARMGNISGISFYHLTYNELCDSLSENDHFKYHITNFREKYLT